METIIIDRDAGVVTVTLNRPHKKNAANATMWSELLQTFQEIAGNAADRAVVITGSGGDFCSGADLSADDRDARPHQLGVMRHIGDVAIALHRLPQPVVAKVRGVAVGAGCNLALGCDLVVAADTARFSQIFVRRGLSVDFGGSWLVPRHVGIHRAKELALLGDIVSAPEAAAMGLVNRVLPEEQLDAFVADWAARLAAGPPIAMAQTKRMLDNSAGATFEQAIDDEGAAQTVNFSTADTAEAMVAFLQKRSPIFQGR
ncbi:MAG: enoyl-CoA hydratase [Ilumatobacteraceae bacterium]